MTLVKICGLRDAETALETAKAGADFIGLMFAESRRRVTPQECYDICEAIRGIERRAAPPVVFDGPGPGEVRGLGHYDAWSEAIETALWRWRPLLVGVFADQPAQEVNEIAEAAGLDLVQISGGETVDYLAKIEHPVVRVLHVAPETASSDLLEVAAERGPVSLMLDTAKAGSRGGTGISFDWEIAAEVAGRIPFFLAGGLTPENVGEAVGTVRPWAVDVSTGVETDGRKDVEKIRNFIKAAKEAGR